MREASEILVSVGGGVTVPPAYRGGWRNTETDRTVWDPRELAEALGAELVVSAPEIRGSTPAMLAARAELLHRLRSTGGRPGLEGATMRRQVSFTPEDWSELERIADAVEETEGLKTTPGQVASALVHRVLAARKEGSKARVADEEAR